MSALPLIALQASLASLAALGCWIWLARFAARRGRSRWRAAPLGLTLLLAAMGYGLFWLAFFSSAAMAVQTHAVRLTIAHALGGATPWIAAGWLALAALPLFARNRA